MSKYGIILRITPDMLRGHTAQHIAELLTWQVPAGCACRSATIKGDALMIQFSEFMPLVAEAERYPVVDLCTPKVTRV